MGIFKPAPSGLRAGRDLVGFLASPGSREWLGLGSPEGLTQVGEGRRGVSNGGRAKVAKGLRLGEVLGAEIPRTFTTNSTTMPDAAIWTCGSSPPPRGSDPAVGASSTTRWLPRAPPPPPPKPKPNFLSSSLGSLVESGNDFVNSLSLSLIMICENKMVSLLYFCNIASKVLAFRDF